MKLRRRELAKVGIFGSKDDPKIVTEKDLKEIVETFPEIKSAPVQFGHWSSPEAPRLGKVVSVNYDETSQTLSGEIEEDDVLAEAVDAGYYPDVSLGAKQRASDGKMYLQHLAYLGQEAPSIKDLVNEIKEPLGIAASDSGTCRMFPSPSEKRLYLSDTPPNNIFYANKNNLDETPNPSDEPSVSEDSGNTGGGGDSAKNTQQEVFMTEDEAKKLQEENERLKADNEAKELALSDAAKQQKTADRERLKTAMNGKIPKAQQDKVFAIGDSLDNGKTLELSDEAAPDGKRKASPVDLLVEVISALPLPVEPGVLNLSDGGNADGSAGNPGRINFSAI